MLKVFEAMTDKESPQKKVTTEEIIQRHVFYIVSRRFHAALIKTSLVFTWIDDITTATSHFAGDGWLLVIQLLFIFCTLFVLWHSGNS